MTYGEQIYMMRVRLAQLDMRLGGRGLRGLFNAAFRAAESNTGEVWWQPNAVYLGDESLSVGCEPIVRLHTDAPTADGSEPSMGYERPRTLKK
jgi:hypothetical protein